MAAAFGGTFAAGVIDQDVLHGHGRGSQERAPVSRNSTAEAKKRLVDEGRRVERVPGGLTGELGRGESTKLIVNQRGRGRPQGEARSFLLPIFAFSSFQFFASSALPVISASSMSRSMASVSRNFASGGIFAARCFIPAYATFNRGSDSAYFFCPSRAAATIDFVLNVVQASGSLAPRIARASRKNGLGFRRCFDLQQCKPDLNHHARQLQATGRQLRWSLHEHFLGESGCLIVLTDLDISIQNLPPKVTEPGVRSDRPTRVLEQGQGLL